MNTVNLHSIGNVQAKAAEEFKPGEKMVWNFGLTSEVVGVVKETAKFITYALLCSDGKVYERRLKKDRLVAFA